MAMTHDYLDYLNEKVGIAPAGSQEELQAANTIADLMRQHNVEPSIEEFDAKTYGGSINAFLYWATTSSPRSAPPPAAKTSWRSTRARAPWS